MLMVSSPICKIGDLGSKLIGDKSLSLSIHRASKRHKDLLKRHIWELITEITLMKVVDKET
jgi:hypothetical protein